MTILIKNKTTAEELKNTVGAFVALFIILAILGFFTYCIRTPLIYGIGRSRGIMPAPSIVPMTYLELLAVLKNEQAVKINNKVLDHVFETLKTEFPDLSTDILMYLFYKEDN